MDFSSSSSFSSSVFGGKTLPRLSGRAQCSKIKTEIEDEDDDEDDSKFRNLGLAGPAPGPFAYNAGSIRLL